MVRQKTVFLDLPAVFHTPTMHRETDSVFCLVLTAVFHSQSTQTMRQKTESACCLSKPKNTNDASEDRVFLDLPAVFHAQTMHRDTEYVFCLVLHAVFHSQSTQTLHQKTESAWPFLLPVLSVRPAGFWGVVLMAPQRPMQ